MGGVSIKAVPDVNIIIAALQIQNGIETSLFLFLNLTENLGCPV